MKQKPKKKKAKPKVLIIEEEVFQAFVEVLDRVLKQRASLEERIGRLEKVLRLDADPKCSLCRGKGIVNWGVPQRLGGEKGPCICRTPPWKLALSR